MSVRILIGDCREKLRELPDASVNCCVTSPPYFGLRDYGVDGQMGLEPTPDEFVAGMVEVFREVRRVLRDDGTLWLNIGDSYSAGDGAKESRPQTNNTTVNGVKVRTPRGSMPSDHRTAMSATFSGMPKPKNLIGIPWMLAFALRADGWYLRQDIIWSKPNPMPESVRDRCTKAHEHIFLLSKSPRYHFDADAISERVAQAGIVERSNLPNKIGAFVDDFGLQVPSSIGAGSAPTGRAGDARRIFQTSVRLAAAILDVAQPQDNFSLLSLDPQVGQQRAQEIASSLIGDHPIIRWAAPQAARFADGDIAAEEFLHELHRLWVTLPDGDKLKEAWRFALLHVGHIDCDGDGAIGVNDASDISQIGFLHSEQDSSISSGSRTNNSWKGSRFDKGKTAAHQLDRSQRWEDRKAKGEPMRQGLAGAGAVGASDVGGGLDRRNKRSVWEVATQPFSEAHFATYPPALIEPCILAGCPQGGTVLDPFFGAGTTGLVADRLGRNAIGIELNPEYAEMAMRRIQADSSLFADISIEHAGPPTRSQAAA